MPYYVVGDFIRMGPGPLPTESHVHSVVVRIQEHKDRNAPEDDHKTIYSMNRVSGQLILHVWNVNTYPTDSEPMCLASTAYAQLKEEFLTWERDEKQRRGGK